MNMRMHGNSNIFATRVKSHRWATSSYGIMSWCRMSKSISNSRTKCFGWRVQVTTISYSWLIRMNWVVCCVSPLRKPKAALEQLKAQREKNLILATWDFTLVSTEELIRILPLIRSSRLETWWGSRVGQEELQKAGHTILMDLGMGWMTQLL